MRYRIELSATNVDAYVYRAPQAAPSAQRMRKTGGPLLRAVDRFSRPLSASPPTCKNYPTEGRGHMCGLAVRSHAPHKNKMKRKR